MHAGLGNVILLERLYPSTYTVTSIYYTTANGITFEYRKQINFNLVYVGYMSTEASDRIQQAHQHVQNAEEYDVQGLLIPAAEEHYKAAEAFQVCMEQATDEQVSLSLIHPCVYILINAVSINSTNER